MSMGAGINHALLPSISKASLPAKYEAAKVALAECVQIDECKEWLDMSAALASYAKQSKDKTLEMAAKRIRGRATRRCGELLAEFGKAQGTRTELRGGASPKLTRGQAATKAGLSQDQAKDAIRVANIPRKAFEEQMESDSPPTITALAKQGKKSANNVPLYEKLGMTRAQFQAGMYFSGDVDDYLKACRLYRIADVVAGTERADRAKLRKNLQDIETFNAQLRSQL